MAIFQYSAIEANGTQRTGTIEAVNVDLAIGALQRRGLIISKIDEAGDKKSLFGQRIKFFERVTNADVVMISRQITTLFEAQVSALRAFKLLAAEARTPQLAEKLSDIANDIQSGSPISTALSQHPDMFSSFYVNMVKSGEETGKLDETFSYLADHMDRNYELTQKARNALVYPAFIMFTFATVMTLMMTLVIPRLALMLDQTGQEIPVYTKIVIAISNFMTHYIVLMLLPGSAGPCPAGRWRQSDYTCSCPPSRR